jgi:DNA topoisomerase IB
MGEDFTCKDFRTYAANHHFVRNLLNETSKRKPKNSKIIKQNITEALKKTAFYLRHTKAISKKSYVMNFTLNLYESDPQYFINKQDDDPNIVLSEILKLYKKKVL